MITDVIPLRIVALVRLKKDDRSSRLRFSIRALLVVTLLFAVITTTYVWINKEPRFIETQFWTNMPPPSEAAVRQQLSESVGEWITIDGAPRKLNEQTAIWIYENTVIAIPDRTDWPNRPSHRSHALVTGYLSQHDGEYELTRTEFEWIDQ